MSRVQEAHAGLHPTPAEHTGDAGLCVTEHVSYHLQQKLDYPTKHERFGAGITLRRGSLRNPIFFLHKFDDLDFWLSER